VPTQIVFELPVLQALFKSPLTVTIESPFALIPSNACSSRLMLLPQEELVYHALNQQIINPAMKIDRFVA